MNATKSRYATLVRQDGSAVDVQARVCDTFLCRLRGLMFRKVLEPKEGLLFVEKTAGVVATSIHMFFVPFPIGVVWFDADGVVVTTCVAQPWRPYYAPDKPAMYYLEAAPEIVDAFEVGERVDIQLPG